MAASSFSALFAKSGAPRSEPFFSYSGKYYQSTIYPSKELFEHW